MGKRNRFVNPDVTKLDLSDGDWIEVKRRLNVGERRSITSRAAKGGVSTDSTRVFVDANEMEFAKVEAWVLDWSFTDAADKRVKFSPEAVRALAFNGAEVVYRPSEATPMTTAGYPGGGTWLIQNQGHAEFNSVYMLCPNAGPVYVGATSKHPVDIAGGSAHIVDYRGQVVSYSASTSNTIVAATVDIEALRNFRAMSLNNNWLKDLRVELYKRMYEQPIHPKNLWLTDAPKSNPEIDEIYRANIRRLQARGTWTKPAYDHPGSRYQPPGDDDTSWDDLKQRLWGPWL